VATLVVTGPAHAADVQITLSNPDEFVMRNFVVTRTTGQEVRGLILVKSFDRASATFTFGDVNGATSTMPAAEIRSIVFHQDVLEGSPIVQEARRQVTVSSVEQQTLAVPADKLSIVDGTLVIGDGLTPAAAQNGERWEASSIRYDPTKRAFDVTVSRVRYKITSSGTGATTFGSERKGLP